MKKLLLLLIVMLIVFVTASMAVPPDLTAGESPNEDPPITFNLGPTGARGWAYHDWIDTGESRQILITDVEPGSPADGILAVDDVILGADGTGANPSNFSSDARKSLGLAIGDAEANNPAELKLLRWRSGTTTTVTLTLQYMGAYSATAPYNCSKSSLILQQGLQYVYDYEDSGRYSFGAITLLADGDPTYQAKAQTEARALIPDQATMDQMMADVKDETSMVAWQRGHVLIFLAEYYLATGDTQVLPAIEAYAVNIAKNTSLFGTTGHGYAERNDDGSANGSIETGYGTVNTPALFCLIGLELAKECGLTNPEIDPAIESATRFFAYYSGKGAIPYGDHEPYYVQHENNGKCGTSALAFMFQNDRVEEGKFFAKMCTASATEREAGHTGAFFNYVWAPLGAAVGGEEAAAALFGRLSWAYDLSRCWDGRFQYDCLGGEGPINGADYNNFRMSTAALLTYALPLRELRITGKAHDSGRWLSSADVAEAVAADDYDATVRSDSELIADLDSWSPKVRYAAGEELGTRTIDSSELDQITTIANDTGGSSRSRAAACYALGQIGDSSSASTLAALLTDSDNYVRYLAGEGMRYLPTADNLTYLDTILTAADTTSQPLYPIVEEDPLHFAHGRLAMLLFYSGSVYGPKGIIWDSVDGVDRNLLYPAIRAVADNPVGQARSTLQQTYQNLDYTDVLTLSGTIIDSIIHRAPADVMFLHGIRAGGMSTLYKFNIAEGVPAGMIYAEDTLWNSSNRIEAFERLGDYKASVYDVQPDPGAVPFLESYVDDPEVGPTCQNILAEIEADTNPTPLAPLKSISSATADDTIVTLPNNSTILRVDGYDDAQGDSVYTWRKISGPGTVSFSDNGTAAAAITTLTFMDTVGTYQFEVTMSDSRALTEEYATVTVELADGPTDVTPPTPDPMTWFDLPVALSDTEITMTATTATDTSDVEYYFDCTSGPGNDSGWQDSPIYTDIGLAPGTEYTYTVTARDKSVNHNATATSSAASATTTGTAPPLKIFILAGQSNMEGHGEMAPVETQGTLEYLINNDPNGMYGHLDDDAGWAVRDDAWIWYKRGGTTLLTGGLSAGFGAADTTIGPELQFGFEMGNVYGEQVLLIKTAWGGKSLYVDFRPPSSGWSVNPPVADGDQGYYYQEMLNYVNDVLANLTNYFPDYDPAAGYELAGFGWHQGWNDRVDQAAVDEYEANMENFINDVRTDLGVPGLPFVIATTGMGGWNETGTSALQLMDAQLAMEDYVTYPAFNGNVAVVDTRDFWRDASVSPADQIYHWNRNAETYFLIGQSMALDLQTLIAGGTDTEPPTPNPARFSSAPTADSDTAISMTASAGSDLSGPVEYLFTEISGNAGGTSSGWQTSPTYTDTGLLAETVYTYTVTMRDSLGYTGTASAAASASTMSYIDVFAPTPNPATFEIEPMTETATSITMTATTGSDFNGPVEYLFTETSGNPGGASSGWQTSATYTDTGLTTGMAYSYTVTLRDSIGNVGTASAPISAMATDRDFFSLNFYAYGSMDEADYDKVTIEADESAGVGSWNAIGWKNYLVPWGLSSPASPVSITSVLGSTATFTLNDVRNGGPYYWSSPHTLLPGDANGDLMDGHCNGTEDPGDGSNIFDMTVSDIPFGTYDVVIYMGANEAQFGDGTAKIVFNGGPEQDFTLTSGEFSAFAEITDSVTPGNYIVYEDVTGSSFTVQVWGNGFNHIAPTGFQFSPQPDFDPPTPDPATFAVAPAADSDTAVSMTATTGTDASGPIEYYFAETSGNPGGTDSGWTTNPVYTDTGLDPDTQYTYTVTMRDNLGNTGTASAPASATTDPEIIQMTVPNCDFETIYKPDSTTITAYLSGTDGTGSGWTQGVGPDCPIDSGQYNFSDSTTGTVADIPGWLGYDRDGWIALGGSYGRDETTGNLQGSVSTGNNHTTGGANCYLVNGDSWGNPAGGLIVSDASLGTIQSDATYTLSMYANGSALPIVLKLLADGVELTPSSSVDPTLSSSHQLFSRTYDAADLTAYVGQSITIVCGIGRNATGTQSHVDDVSLEYYVDTPTDTDPPTPDPATFATAPYATGTDSIAMTATTGTDASGPVEYLFTETSGNPGGTSSGWQTSTSYTDSGLDASTQYTYTVTMRDSLGNTGTASSPASATTDAVNQPPAFTSDPFSTSDATEDAAYSDTIAGSATDPDVGDTLTFSKTAGPTWLSVASDGALSGTPSSSDVGANSFTVQVSDGNGGTDSATLNITVNAAASPPAAPSGLSATAISASQVDLSWTDNANDETGFKIERSDNNPNNFVQIATVGTDVTSFSDTAVSKNRTYYYRVRATNAEGDSAYSNQTSATTPKK